MYDDRSLMQFFQFCHFMLSILYDADVQQNNFLFSNTISSTLWCNIEFNFNQQVFVHKVLGNDQLFKNIESKDTKTSKTNTKNVRGYPENAFHGIAEDFNCLRILVAIT